MKLPLKCGAGQDALCLPASWLSSYQRIAPLDAELLHSCPLYCENKQCKSDGTKLEKPEI